MRVRVSLSMALDAFACARPERASVVAEMRAVLDGPTPLSRQRFDPGHFTASAFVCNSERRRVLLIHHAKLGRWLQPGGHVEPGDADLLAAARREVAEETGLESFRPLVDGIFDVDVHEIPATPKEPAHRHHDVRYALIASDDRLQPSSEVLDARWVPFAEVPSLTDEWSVLRCTRALARVLNEAR